jgi:HSP20 family protein
MNDEKNDISIQKKGKFNDRVIVEEHFYVHDKPKEAGDLIMGMDVEQADMVSGNSQLLVKGDDGKERPITRAQASQLMNRNIPNGINIPGQTNNQPRKQQPNKKAPTKQNTKISSNESGHSTNGYPPTQMAMVDDAYHMYIDLPGVAKEDLSVILDNQMLHVSGKRDSSIDVLRKELKKGTRKDPILQSNSSVANYMLGKFTFNYPFNKRIDETPGKMTAQFNDGVLYVMLPHMVKGKETAIPIM